MNRSSVTSANLSQMLKDESLSEIETRLREGNSVTIMVRGWSMRPLLFNLRDSAVIAPITGELKCGDVVVFKYKERMLLHRIMVIEGDNLIIKGDGVPYSREQVKREAVLGIMREAIRRSERRISCDSPQWIRMSQRWAAIPPFMQSVILKFLRLLEKIKLI